MLAGYTVGEVRKAVAAFITAAIGLAALFGVNPEIATAENIGLAATVVATITGLVFGLKNDPA